MIISQSHNQHKIFINEVKPFEELFKSKTLWGNQTQEINHYKRMRILQEVHTHKTFVDDTLVLDERPTCSLLQ
jgi:hypothetical protein